MTKLLNFIKRIFGKKEPPSIPDDVVSRVMTMVRNAIEAGNGAKLKAIFAGLNPGATRIVMERLDHIERRLLLTLLG